MFPSHPSLDNGLYSKSSELLIWPITVVVIKTTVLKGFLKSLTPNDEIKFCLDHTLLSKKNTLQTMDTAHANVTAVTNNQQKL